MMETEFRVVIRHDDHASLEALMRQLHEAAKPLGAKFVGWSKATNDRRAERVSRYS